MKTRFYFIIIIIATLVSCKKEPDPGITFITIGDILGKWVNTSNHNDSIIIDSTGIGRWYPGCTPSTSIYNGNCYLHDYRCSLKNDSLYISYVGIDKVYAIGMRGTRKVILNKTKDTLEIENFKTIYPGITGDYFKKIKEK